MSYFPSTQHLASWARLGPATTKAVVSVSMRAPIGNRWLRTALVEAAWAAARTKHTYLSAQYHRLAAGRGGKRAAVAVAYSILVVIYHLLDWCELPRPGRELLR